MLLSHNICKEDFRLLLFYERDNETTINHHLFSSLNYVIA